MLLWTCEIRKRWVLVWSSPSFSLKKWNFFQEISKKFIPVTILKLPDSRGKFYSTKDKFNIAGKQIYFNQLLNFYIMFLIMYTIYKKKYRSAVLTNMWILSHFLTKHIKSYALWIINSGIVAVKLFTINSHNGCLIKLNVFFVSIPILFHAKFPIFIAFFMGQ